MKLFFKIILTCCTLFTTGLQATGISPLLFKNVNQCFKPGFEYNSPIFGSIALSTGLIENLRFYNVEAFYDANETREYIKDKPVQNDPIMTIVRILFPSPTGQLATSTEATNAAGKKTSFGWHCQSDPTRAAALLNFTHAVRAWFAAKKPADKLPQTVDKILTKIDPNKVIEIVFPKNDFKPTELNALLTALAQAIELEIAPPKKSFKPSFYPKYFIEQIITAFFCYSFAKQDDLKTFLSALNDDIVDKSKINAIDGEIKEDDITAAIAKLDNQNSVTLDDIWTLLNRKASGRILPYENGKNPISNASAKMYQRSTNTVSNNKTFADCIEVALRHIANFMLYDAKTDSFNLDVLKAHMQGKNNPYIENLYDFYEKEQSSSAANAGDPNIRAAWNKAVADLGNGIHYRENFDDSDPQPNNELDTGMINFMRVFKTLFSLELPPEPVYQAGKDDEFKNNVQEWVRNGLEGLFNLLNPNYHSSITFERISMYYIKDLLGRINIKIRDTSGLFLFGFTIRIS